MGRARAGSVGGGRPRLSWGEGQGLRRGRWGERRQRGGVNVQQIVGVDALTAVRCGRCIPSVGRVLASRRRNSTLCYSSLIFV